MTRRNGGKTVKTVNGKSVPFGIGIIFGSVLVSKSRNFMLEMHLLKVLFGTNLVSNISPKASKKHHI